VLWFLPDQPRNDPGGGGGNALKSCKKPGKNGQSEKKWKKRVFGVDTTVGPSYNPPSLPCRAALHRPSGTPAKRRSLFENVRSFWKRFAGGGRCERTVLCKTQSQPDES
tara:strand:- start:21 stop:347 length:327 start_codon:yes stop_codon:yes gene_type:complete